MEMTCQNLCPSLSNSKTTSRRDLTRSHDILNSFVIYFSFFFFLFTFHLLVLAVTFTCKRPHSVPVCERGIQIKPETWDSNGDGVTRSNLLFDQTLLTETKWTGQWKRTPVAVI